MIGQPDLAVICEQIESDKDDNNRVVWPSSMDDCLTMEHVTRRMRSRPNDVLTEVMVTGKGTLSGDAVLET